MKPNPVPPGPGQESVWDYPRPPRVEAVDEEVEVYFAGRSVAYTDTPLRVLETSHPPVYYVPPDAIDEGVLEPNGNTTFCEYKGEARYFDLVVGDKRSKDAAWAYEAPAPGYEALAGYVAFYPGRVESALLDGEAVQPQPGSFYGGWITTAVVGPFKGLTGTADW
ncbi:MAG TPA: DUF427 domain-containing protein [Acidimicrobiales bacterium]